MSRVTVRAPATSANLGPGFDCLGLALDLYNTLTLEVGRYTVDPRVEVTGEGQRHLPRNGRNLVVRVAQAVLDAASSGLAVSALALENHIPVAGGLGSSAAAIAGGMAAANALLDCPFSIDELLRMALRFEPHPDNLAAAFYGGFTVAVLDTAGRPIVASFPPPSGLRAVVLTPAIAISTHESRAALPSSVPHADAAYTVGRAALLVAALLNGRHELLRPAMDDRLHQPYRARAYPALEPIMHAALEAGAAGACLSGSGPSILALCSGPTDPVVQAMRQAAETGGLAARVHDLAIVPHGAHVVFRP